MLLNKNLVICSFRSDESRFPKNIYSGDISGRRSLELMKQQYLTHEYFEEVAKCNAAMPELSNVSSKSATGGQVPRLHHLTGDAQ